MRNPLLRTKKKDQRELVFQRLKNSQQRNVVYGQRVPVTLSAMSNLSQSRRRKKLSKIAIVLSNNLLLKRNRNYKKKKSLSSKLKSNLRSLNL